MRPRPGRTQAPVPPPRPDQAVPRSPAERSHSERYCPTGPAYQSGPPVSPGRSSAEATSSQGPLLSPGRTAAPGAAGPRAPGHRGQSASSALSGRAAVMAGARRRVASAGRSPGTWPCPAARMAVPTSSSLPVHSKGFEPLTRPSPHRARRGPGRRTCPRRSCVLPGHGQQRRGRQEHPGALRAGPAPALAPHPVAARGPQVAVDVVGQRRDDLKLIQRPERALYRSTRPATGRGRPPARSRTRSSWSTGGWPGDRVRSRRSARRRCVSCPPPRTRRRAGSPPASRRSRGTRRRACARSDRRPRSAAAVRAGSCA